LLGNSYAGKPAALRGIHLGDSLWVYFLMRVQFNLSEVTSAFFDAKLPYQFQQRLFG
jgi:hypothetical protein